MEEITEAPANAAEDISATAEPAPGTMQEEVTAPAEEAAEPSCEEAGVRTEYDGLLRQAEETRGIYPTFDLAAELRDPRFTALLRSREVDMRTAYEIVHRDEIIPAMIRYTAKHVEERLAEKMRLNAERPLENGTASAATAVSTVDVSKMTKSERRAIAKRVMMGETISF